MKGFLFRDWVTSGLLAFGIVLGAMALSSVPAWPGETVRPPIIVEPPAPIRVGNEGSVTLPMVGKCALPLHHFTDNSDYRLLTGYHAIQYMTAAGIAPIVGIDTVLFTTRDEDVIAVLFAKRGCVTVIRQVTAAEHRAVLERAFGASLYPTSKKLVLVQAPPGAPPELKCGPRAKFVAELAKGYKEQQAGFGLAAPTVIMEVFVGPTGSWTMLMSYAKGVSCVVATGQHWTNVKLPVPGEMGS